MLANTIGAVEAEFKRHIERSNWQQARMCPIDAGPVQNPTFLEPCGHMCDKRNACDKLNKCLECGASVVSRVDSAAAKQVFAEGDRSFWKICGYTDQDGMIHEGLMPKLARLRAERGLPPPDEPPAKASSNPKALAMSSCGRVKPIINPYSLNSHQSSEDDGRQWINWFRCPSLEGFVAIKDQLAAQVKFYQAQLAQLEKPLPAPSAPPMYLMPQETRKAPNGPPIRSVNIPSGPRSSFSCTTPMTPEEDPGKYAKTGQIWRVAFKNQTDGGLLSYVIIALKKDGTLEIRVASEWAEFGEMITAAGLQLDPEESGTRKTQVVLNGILYKTPMLVFTARTQNQLKWVQALLSKQECANQESAWEFYTLLNKLINSSHNWFAVEEEERAELCKRRAPHLEKRARLLVLEEADKRKPKPPEPQTISNPRRSHYFPSSSTLTTLPAFPLSPDEDGKKAPSSNDAASCPSSSFYDHGNYSTTYAPQQQYQPLPQYTPAYTPYVAPPPSAAPAPAQVGLIQRICSPIFSLVRFSARKVTYIAEGIWSYKVTKVVVVSMCIMGLLHLAHPQGPIFSGEMARRATHLKARGSVLSDDLASHLDRFKATVRHPYP